MRTFRRTDLDPLEVNSDILFIEIVMLAERAFAAEADSLMMIRGARDSAEEGDDFATKQFMRMAMKRDKLNRVLCQELGRKLVIAGYGLHSPVAVGRVAVALSDRGSAILLGTVSDIPPEALAALDAALEGDSDPDWSDRDELNQRMYEYSQMINLN